MRRRNPSRTRWPWRTRRRRRRGNRTAARRGTAAGDGAIAREGGEGDRVRRGVVANELVTVAIAPGVRRDARGEGSPGACSMRREEDGVGNANARRDAADVGRKGGGGRDRDGSNGRLRTRRTSRSWEGVAPPEPIGRACAIAKTESSAKSAAVDVIDRPIAGVGRTARGSFCGLTGRRGGDNFFGVGFERLRVLLSFTDARSESAIGSGAQRDRTPDRSRPERFKPSTSDADDSRFVPSRLVRAPPPLVTPTRAHPSP